MQQKTRKMTKNEKILDLEYAMPKEDRIYATKSVYMEEEIADDTGISECESDTCGSCGRDSEETVLLSVLHHGEQNWVCLKCLKTMMGIKEESASHSVAETSVSSEPQSPPGGMSMFG